MKKLYMLNGSLILLVLLGGTTFWNLSRSSAHTNSAPTANNGELNPLVNINQKARAAKSGGEAATRELIDENISLVRFRSTVRRNRRLDQGPSCAC